jgi:hypothetical protein
MMKAVWKKFMTFVKMVKKASFKTIRLRPQDYSSRERVGTQL